MGNEDYGESSRGNEEEEEEEENTRPLKKAKYVWQVKGKYHLKASCQNKTPGLPEENVQNNNNIDKFLARTESILESSDEEESSKNIDRSISNEIPITLVSNTKNQDYYLKKWQTRQIARGYIDNTINSVLETWASTAPWIDAEDFLDKCEDDGQVEDEGILMAIQAHGLQSNTEQKSETFRTDQESLDQFDTVRNKVEEFAMEVVPDKSPPLEDVESNFDDIVYPVDILNAAILVAIEKKGLSSCNTA